MNASLVISCTIIIALLVALKVSIKIQIKISVRNVNILVLHVKDNLLMAIVYLVLAITA